MILIQNYISVPNLFNNIKEIPYRVYFNHSKQKLLIFKKRTVLCYVQNEKI